MKKKFSKPSAILSVILSVLMLLSVFPVMSFAAYPVEYYYPDGTTFVSEIAFARTGYWGVVNLNSTKEKLTNAGYSAFDWDFNDGCGTGSDWIAGGWKNSTNIGDALRDIKFWVGDSGSVPLYYDLTVNGRSVRYYLVGGTYEPNSVTDGGVVDLNSNAGGKYIYAFITRDPAAGAPITDIKFNDKSSVSGYTTCTKLMATSSTSDLNEGAGGSDLFMHTTHNSTVVNTSNLHSVYALAKNMVPNEANYTIATYNALETAYNNATPIVNALNSYGASIFDQSAINTAYNDLYSAVYGAETNLYFNASNNGGTTTAKATTVKIGPDSTYSFDVSSYTATKGSWNFIGWNTNKNATTGSKTTVNIGFNNTLYAIYGKDVSTTFKYILDDGSVKTETATGTIYNTAVQTEITGPAATDISLDGDTLTFLGWRDDATTGVAEYDSAVPVKDGINYIYRAVYSAPVVLSFDNNGGESAAPTAISTVKYFNADDTVKEGTAKFTVPADTLTKTGYSFIGWSEDKNADTATYLPGAELETQSDVTLYAVWSQNKYPVVFKNYDGEELQNTDVPYGDMPSYTGSTPVKPGTIDTKWVFDGWDKEFAAVTGAQEYTATFYSAIADYSVKFVNEDGTVLQDTMVNYNEMPEYFGATPEKAATAQYSYTFKGWDKAFEVVTGEQVYTATYNSTVNSYKVYFINDDGTVLQEEVLEYGTTPSYKGETPLKKEDAQYVYTFDKWDSEIVPVTGETTYTATYKGAIKSYEIRFVNHDGAELYKVTLKYGAIPQYKGVTPTKEADIRYAYSFDGWDPEITAVTGEATYTAQFQSEAKKLIVTFFNYDGNVLESKFVEYDSVPVYTGEEPVRKATAQYSYVFTGWDKEFEAITERTEYYAQYDETVNEYTVIFENYNGEVLQSEVLEYGSAVEYKGETPVRPTDNYVYSFSGWNKTVSPVTGDAVYTAVFDKVSAAYTVKFLDEDGTVLQTKFYAYGDVPVYEGEALEKAYNSGVHYEFSGWNKDIVAVSENTSYVAVYKAYTHTCVEAELTAPTCTADGKIVYACECGYSYIVTDPAFGHNYEYVIEGETAYKTCTVCGDKVEVSLEEAETALGTGTGSASGNLCSWCGKYHYKYIFPDLGFIGCLISRIFSFFAELFVK